MKVRLAIIKETKTEVTVDVPSGLNYNQLNAEINSRLDDIIKTQCQDEDKWTESTNFKIKRILSYD